MEFTQNLIPVDSHKSFYGKAKVIIRDGKTLLKSYNTIVCEIDENGAFKRTWYGWSATTARHIDSFRAKYGLPRINKATWCKMEVEAI